MVGLQLRKEQGPMLQSLEIEGVGPIPRLSAKFGSRLNILTGDNGLGKSFLLDACFWAITDTWPGGRAAMPSPNGKKKTPSIVYRIAGKAGQSRERHGAFAYDIQAWKRQSGRTLMPGLAIYAGADGGFAVWDSARNFRVDPERGIRGKEILQPQVYQFTQDSIILHADKTGTLSNV
jgi:hypothetical protein